MTRAPIHFTPGVLAKDQLEELIKRADISSTEFEKPKVGGSAIDLRLSSKAWKLNVGGRPTTRELGRIQAKATEIEPTGAQNLFEFEKGQIYLVKLDHHLRLPVNISGRATGKSSVGRLDVITRLITNPSREYDLVAAGYEGDLHLLLMPQTFTIRVAPGASVNQLRLFSGAHAASVITRMERRDYGTRFWWLLKEDTDGDYEDEELEGLDATEDPLLFDLTVDLGDKDFPYVFKARTGVTEPIDLAAQKTLDPRAYFERVSVIEDGPDRSVELDSGSFYIMKSRERLCIPDDVAVEVVAISERIGDIRIHYAGFAHPGFGRTTKGRHGTPLIFEVRATDMKTKLYHRSLLARIQLFRMSRKTTADDSAYEKQELKLSNVFADWPAEGS